MGDDNFEIKVLVVIFISFILLSLANKCSIEINVKETTEPAQVVE